MTYRIDADRIAPRLYQGSKPPLGRTLARNGVTMLVLCAEEWQPSSKNFPGVTVVHTPLDDHGRPLSQAEWNAIIGSAMLAGDNIRRGGCTLITCAAGLNRSGIVTAVTLSLLTGWPAERVVDHIRARRDRALCNESFVRQLRQVL